MRADQDLATLTNEMLAIIYSIDDNTGELTEETYQRLETLSGEFPDKVEAVCKVISALCSREASLRAEQAKFLAAARRNANAVQRLREHLLRAMKTLNVPSVTGSLYRVSVKKSPPRVVIPVEAIGVLPDELMVIEKSPDKVKIREALSLGQPLPEGIHLVQDDHIDVRII